jgi:hypothetical protein
MQYTIDTLNIEISRLHKAIRRLKNRLPLDDQESTIQERVSEMEGNVREIRKAISILKDYARNSSSQYQSQYTTGFQK